VNGKDVFAKFRTTSQNNKAACEKPPAKTALTYPHH